MADTEDYSEEVTPSAHHESHEAGGDDEISLEGLTSEASDVTLDTTDFDVILSPADDDVQKALDTIDEHGHAQLHDQNTDQYLDEGGTYECKASMCKDAYTKRHTRNLDQWLDQGGSYPVTAQQCYDAVDLRHAQLHATEHVTGGDDVIANAVAEGNAGLMTGADKNKLDTQMGIHEALPTIHQDAPDLILTHKGDASAHHVKYTDSDAVAALVAAAAVFKSLFDAATFLYATLDDTPEAKTAAQVLAILSAQATAPFSFNSQNLSAVGTIALTGGQIAFPATAVPSAEPNTLDDYQEGTWTVGIAFGGAVVGITYAYQAGYYTKIGNIVTISGYVQLTSKGTSVGDATITGLPFTVINNPAGYAGVALWLTAISFTAQFQAYTLTNSTTISLENITEAGVRSSLTDANFSNTSAIIISCTYRVA